MTAVPDWTYQPLRTVAAAALGERRAQRAALRSLAVLCSLPGGAALAGQLSGASDRSASVAARLGVTVPVEVAQDAVRAMPALGAGVVEVGPVGADDVAAVRQAAAGRRCTVVARAGSAEVAEQLAPYVDRVVSDAGVAGEHAPYVDRAVSNVELAGEPAPCVDRMVNDAEVAGPLASQVDRVVSAGEPGLIRLGTSEVGDAVAALAKPGVVVLANPEILIDAGPGWFQRVNEAATATEPATSTVPATDPSAVGLDPRRWPAWWWGVLVGLGMILGGLVAATITLGPLLLWYDNDYLGAGSQTLHAVNPRLVHFVQHDRITLAGTMVVIGVLYTGIAWGGIRRGWAWARTAYLASGAVGFPTLFYFLGSGFLEPLHLAAAVILFPMFLLAIRRPALGRGWTVLPDGPEPERRRALIGQLLMILVGVGLTGGGIVISVVGLTSVFVPTDLTFMNTDAHYLHSANPQLVPFIAHDRAGFGGALISAGVAITLLSVWGWRRGEAWVWWTLTLGAISGFGPALVVHLVIRYTSVPHLAPLYLGAALTAVALTLARPYLCHTGPGRPSRSRRAPS
jgi:hypothetical protein